ELQHAGWRVGLDPFTAYREGKPFRAHNVVGFLACRTDRTVLLVAHYDSRPCADEDPDPSLRGQPVLGANDGGSGVAVLLELTHALQGRMLNLTLRFAFVDAEDMGDSGHGCGAGTAWAQGAAHDAENLTAEDVRAAKALILLDLVGDPQIRLPREGASALGANRAVQDAVWATGERLGHAAFRDEVGPSVDDDHLPYGRRGIPSVDVIDLRPGSNIFPPSHHTTFDDLAHTSPASLGVVGQTVLAQLLAWDAEAGA
ncbi:MAG: M28 family peptidase, partial [Halobacteriales archaeon]|nr:M28 family peptidase [Halobacteriales archaeon]